MKNREKETEYLNHGQGYKYKWCGWTYVHIEGEPFERGEQYGFLVREEFEKLVNITKKMTYHLYGVPYEYFVEKAVPLMKSKIPAEFLEEMDGFASGLTKAGLKTSLNDIIGWNAYPGMSYWWAAYGMNEYIQEGMKRAGMPADNFGAIVKGPKRHGHCSAFAATGNATIDGKMVIAHQTFDDFWNAGSMNIMLDLKPTRGARILMQTAPGYIWSNTDFFICKSEEHNSCIAGLETTIIETTTFVIDAIPEWVRARKAMQYGYSIQQWIDLMQEGNNGSNPGSWLLGDAKTNEIGRLEQGYLFQNIEIKKDGHFFGCNCVEDPRIRNLECTDVGFNDIRRQTGGRRTRWLQLMKEYSGKIDVEAAKIIMADTINVYAQQNDLAGNIIPGQTNINQGGANTICSMYDKDPRYFFSSLSGAWPDPYTPAGSLDAKITSSDLMNDNMTMKAIWGRANGEAFDAQKFLERHPQWEWQKDCLESRPSQSWTEFWAEEF